MSAAFAIPSHGIVHVCSCRAAYTLPEWLALRHVGDQRTITTVLSLRECRCGRHRSVPIEDEGRHPLRAPGGRIITWPAVRS